MSDSFDIIEEKQTRREMFRSLLRYSITGGLGSAWVVLYVRSARSTTANTCAQPFSCGACPLLERCDLPKADKTRNENKRQ